MTHQQLTYTLYLFVIGILISSYSNAQKYFTFNGEPGQRIFLSHTYPIVLGDSVMDHGSLIYLGEHEGEKEVSYDLFKKIPKYLIVESSGKRTIVKKIETSWNSDVEKKSNSRIEIKIPKSEPYMQFPINKEDSAMKDVSFHLIMDEVVVNVPFDSRNSTYKKYKYYEEEKKETENTIEYFFTSILASGLHAAQNNKKQDLTKSKYERNIHVFAEIEIEESIDYYNSYLNINLNVKTKDSYGTVLAEGWRNIHSMTFNFNEVIHEIQNSMVKELQFSLLKKSIDKLNKKKQKLDSLNTISIAPSKVYNSLSNATKSVVTVKTNKGHGSGCIIDSSGYIITNHHVVANADTIDIIHSNGDTIAAKFVRSNPYKDLALLKCDSTTFQHYFSLSNKKTTKESGDLVYVIGTPAELELNNSISKGYIAGYRPQMNDGIYQIGASINPGNSGGALVDAQGNLTGVINAKLVGLGVKKIGYAIPIHLLPDALKLKLNH